MRIFILSDLTLQNSQMTLCNPTQIKEVNISKYIPDSLLNEKYLNVEFESKRLRERETESSLSYVATHSRNSIEMVVNGKKEKRNPLKQMQPCS